MFLVIASLDPHDYGNPKDYEIEQEAQVRFWMSFVKACSLPEASGIGGMGKPVVVMVGSRADKIQLTQPFDDLATKVTAAQLNQYLPQLCVLLQSAAPSTSAQTPNHGAS